jgi:hypothetical protein
MNTSRSLWCCAGGGALHVCNCDATLPALSSSMLRGCGSFQALNVGPSGLPLLTGHHLQVLDTSRVAAAGHSRGGKMAALMLAGGVPPPVR